MCRDGDGACSLRFIAEFTGLSVLETLGAGGTARSMALPPPPASVLWTEQSGWPQWDAGPDMLAKVCGEGRVARPPEISNPWFSGSAVNLRLGNRWLLPWFKDLFLKLSLSFDTSSLLPSSCYPL